MKAKAFQQEHAPPFVTFIRFRVRMDLELKKKPCIILLNRKLFLFGMDFDPCG